ncbi:MAG: VWA domain-containing protein [Acidobacteria bacterium]|nr:VWA domain-containing protein [Acidobacteriota bacterium]
MRSDEGRMLRWIAVAVAAAGLALGQGLVLKSEARLVEVPVVVVDKKTGRTVGDLSVGDFQVFEGGKAQRIEFFSVHSTAAVSAVGDSHAVSTEGHRWQSPGVRGGVSNRRRMGADAAPVVTILIDGYNARYEEQYYAAKAAADVILREERRAQWGVYFLGPHGLRVIHDYTEDAGSVAARLRGLRAPGDAAMGIGFEADDRGQREVANAAARFPAVDSTGEIRMRIQTTLGALRDIGRHLGALPGRKSLVWMTAGVSLQQIVAVLPEWWKDTLNTLNDGNVAVYAIDSAGVRTSAGNLAERPTRSLTLRPAAGSGFGMTGVMFGVAESTGGRAYVNTNDLGKSVTRALNDSQTFYRLAYRPVHGRWDGRYLRIQVKVPGRRGVEVRHRQGYFAREAGGVEPARVDRMLAEAVASPLEAVDVGLTVELKAVEGSKKKLLVVTADPLSVSLEERRWRFGGKFYVRCVQLGVDGGVKQDFTDEVKLDLEASDARRTVEEGFRYRKEVEMEAGAVTMKVAFCDEGSGRLGSVRVALGN